MTNDTNSATPKATVYHDGDCPLCNKEVKLMQKMDAANAIKWVDINQDKQALLDAGITHQQAMDRIHVADESLQMHTGVAGFLNIWKHLPYYRRLVPIIKHTPFLLTIMEGGYRVFAKHRLRLTNRHAKHSEDTAGKL